jgi:hypothetical protein
MARADRLRTSHRAEERDMAGARTHANLDLAQDLDHQQRDWLIQRAGWVAMALIVVGALLGLFGAGPLSTAHVTGDQGLRGEYRRFWRMQSPMTLRVTLPASARHDRERAVRVDRGYFDAVRITYVNPPPERVEAGNGELRYVFAISNSLDPVTVSFTLEAPTPGAFEGRAALDAGPWVGFSQFIYP